MAFCTNCGAPTGGEGKKFCTKCGAALQEIPEPETPTALTTVLPPTPGTESPKPPAFGAPEPPTVFVPAEQPPTEQPPTEQPPTEQPPTEQPPVQQPPVQQPPVQQPPVQQPPSEQSPTFVSPPGSWPPAPPPPTPSYESPGPASWPQPPLSYDSPGPASWPQPPGHDVPPAGPGEPEPPYRPRSGRTATWIGFAVAAVVVLAGGGFAAWKFLGHQTAPHPGPTAPATSTANQANSPAPSTPAPATTPPAPSPTQSGPGGTFPVAVAPAAAQQPGQQQVVAFLQSYFTAINDHNYARYAPLLVASQRPTPQEFQSGDGTTTDSAATLTGLAPTGNGMAATVKFTSHQSPSASPTRTACTSWHITLYLQSHAGGYRIEPAPPGYHAHYRAC